MSTLIIAEAGVNHNGSLEMAHSLIDAAAACGADFVKFQTFKAERIVSPKAKKATYQILNTKTHESQYEMLRALELPEKYHYELVQHCAEVNIGFLSTGFDIESVKFLLSIGMEYFKIPSGEITNLPYLRFVGALKKRVILSTGMANLGEVEAAVNILCDSGTSRDNIIVLHCTTEYPAPMDEVNLKAMLTMGTALDVNVGYSDHTDGIEISIAATAMGAKVIEKHFTIDRDQHGPDHMASIDPSDFKKMVLAIRNVEKALGSGVKRPYPSEVANITVARKSLVAKHKIQIGEMFSDENLCTMRPGSGISPMRWDEVVGRLASRVFEPGELIEI